MYVNPNRYIIKVVHVGGIQYIGQGGASSPDRAHVTPMSQTQAELLASRLRGVQWEIIRV